MTDKTPNSYAMIFIFTTVLLDMVGFGLIIPVLPELIKTVGHMDIGSASVIGGWMFFAYGATQFLFGPTMGSLSDAYGRRPLLLLAVFGLGLDYLISAFAPTIMWLFVARAVAGLCGASYVIANAYIADITAPENRAKAFGMIGAAFGLGFIIGPAIGGLLGEYGPRVPFFVAAAVSGLNFVFGYFILPETLPPEKRRPFEWARANPIGTLKIFSQYHGVMRLCAVMFIYFFASAIYPAIWPFWGVAKFGWSAATIGLTLAAFGLLAAIVQGGLTGPVVKYFGENKTAIGGMIVAVVALFGYGITNSFTMVMVMLIIHAPEGLIAPTLTAIISKEVPEDAQGEMQGGLASVQNLAMLIGTVFFSQIFGFFLTGDAPIQSPDVAYFVAGVLMLGALVLLVWPRSLSSPPEKDLL